MIRKLLSVLLTLVILISAISFTVTADIEPPSSLGAPAHFGVSYRSGNSVKLYISASDSVRDYMARRVQDDPENKGFTLYYQVDAKINNGSWQYTPDWDSPKTVPDNHKNRYYIPCSDGKFYAGPGYAYFEHLFSDEAIAKTIGDAGWDYFENNSITLRARFAQSFDNGETYVLSPWSKEFVLSANVKLDTGKMIDHAPTLKGAELEMRGDTPYLAVKLEKAPQDIGDLSVAAGGSVRVEIWLRKQGDKDFKQIHYWWVSDESILFDVRNYFEDYKDSYEAAAYEIKVRYALDLREYPQSGHKNSTVSVDIYSPFSNVISHNMPAWSEASQWATGELKKADDAGLIPDILKGADMTKPITREEFAELAVKLYEKTTGTAATAASPNPFTDTTNPQILKAFKLGVTTGTSATTFSPVVPINREQCAAMLFRTIKAIHSGGAYSVAGIPDFPDQKDISAYAVEAAKYMSKLGIVKGDAKGNFMPKGITDAQTAAGYGMATREAAILMSVRTYDQMDTIKASKAPSVAAPEPTPVQKAPTPAHAAPAAPTPVVGTWILGTLSGGQFNAASGKYEGGATGLGQIYTFKEDGTYTALVIWSNAMYFTGRYSVKDGMLTLTDRAAEESNDDGKTWGAKETLPDTSAYFTAGTDDTGKYLLIGEEGATPPLVDKTNALKYRLKE